MNRYAKPTDPITNIITSEDDTFYILTRRLIDEFEYFSVEGEESALDNPNILFVSSFNGGERQFTTLDTLAKMNEILLKTNKFPRLNKSSHKITGEIRGDRQSDEDLNKWYKELESRWQAIFNVFPELTNDRSQMRSHNSKIEYILDLLEKIKETNEKVVIFSFWLKPLFELEKRINKVFGKENDKFVRI